MFESLERTGNMLTGKPPRMDYDTYKNAMDIKIRHEIEEEKKKENPYYPYEITDFPLKHLDKAEYSHIIRIGKYMSPFSDGFSWDYCFWVTINGKEKKWNWAGINPVKDNIFDICKNIENACREEEGIKERLKIYKHHLKLSDREMLNYILKMQMISFHTATGEYLKRLCDIWEVEYSNDETDEAIREHLLQEMKNFWNC